MEQKIINKLRAFFKTSPVEKAWVFGSYARGEMRKGSDIDILVRFSSGEKVSLFQYVEMIDKLHSILRKKVDLVEEGQIKDFANASVEKDKILVYEREN